MKLRSIFALAPALLLAQCAPQCTSGQHTVPLPDGAYADLDGCINIDALPKYPRLSYDGETWTFDGVAFGHSVEEDSCIKPIVVTS